MKITICISGETRDWNNYPSKNLGYFITRLTELGHQVKVVGHTWSHCEQPLQHHVTFDKLVIDDQVMIEEWVKEDWIHRLSISEEVAERFNYDDDDDFEYDNLSNDDQYELAYWCRHAYGQHISGYKSFQLADNDADLYIRWRWDLIFNKLQIDVIEDEYKDNIDYWMQYLNDLFEQCAMLESSSSDGTDVHFGGSTIVHGLNNICVDDTFFAFTSRAKERIDLLDIFDAIHEYSNIKNPALNREVYHTLWLYIMTEYPELEGACSLPACVRATYRPARFQLKIDEFHEEALLIDAKM
jgi:hypothetical protein